MLVRAPLWVLEGACVLYLDTVGSGIVEVRRGCGVIIRSAPGWNRSFLVEWRWHTVPGIVGRIEVRLPCPPAVGT
jgi:hypothetical protein